jgi:signal transduction histidine kinase
MTWKPWTGLRSRLTSLVILAVLITGGIEGASLLNHSEAALRAEVLEGNLETADVATAFASDYVTDVTGSVREFASRPQVLAALYAGTPEDLNPDLARFLEQNPRLESIRLVNVIGFPIASATPPSPARAGAGDRDWLQRTVGTAQPYLGVPVISRTSGRPVLSYGVPILDEQRTVRAVLVAGVSVARLSEAITRIRVGREARAWLGDLREGGMIVAHPNATRILEPMPERGTMVSRLAAGERGTLTMTREGVPLLVAFSPVADLPWAVVIEQPEDIALAPIVQLRQQAMLLFFAAIGIASGIGIWLTLYVTRPLVRLRRAATQLAEGNLTARVGVARSDEIGDLSRAFDQMADSLAERTAALEGAAKELEAFSYTVSHDLRAPLRAMDGFSRILVEDHGEELSEEAQRFLARVRENAVQMGELIDDLLAFSRLSRQPLALQPIEPANVAREALATLQMDQDLAGAELHIGDLPRCQADHSLLRQVFANLLGNALKFSRGRRPARIEVGSCSDNGTTAYFVKDNGAGFDMQYADQLFRVFQRLHRAEDYEGTGVGLAIVQRVIQRHGGRVWAEAAPGQGATFYFTLEGGNGSPA